MGKAVIVGGSIAGLCCAHSLLCSGWEVVVLEKTISPGCATGAGLGLEPLAQKIIQSWLIKQSPPDGTVLELNTLPLTIDQNQAVDGEKKIGRVLTRDESFNFRAAHWSDLHSLLYKALPPDTVQWGNMYLSFAVSHDKSRVKVKSKIIQTGFTVEMDADMLVAADGCRSSIRQNFLPHFKLRYSGYCAWRGVFDFSDNESSDTILGLKRAYPDLGRCLYFDLGPKTHTGLYELLNKRMNWIWYINQPEPQLKGNSVTGKVSEQAIKKMHEDADKMWLPELARLIRETKDPFLNVIYDCDPLEQIVWDNVVLIGDAAHPTTPHGLRSTNMSVIDAAVLGRCLEKWGGVENLKSGLEEYQRIRLPVTSQQVLFSRRLGKIKQGLESDDDGELLFGKDSLQQKNMPFLNQFPSVLCGISV